MKEKYIAFLRGINVGGHHKVPMAELRTEMEKLGFENVITILNSGNIIFDGPSDTPENIEKILSAHLQKVFGFAIPTMVRTADMILALLQADPFSNEQVTKDIRLYISFLRSDKEAGLSIPWSSEDGSYRILDKRDKMIISVLDVSVTKTPKAMEALEKNYGKDITTRNWNTIKRIEKKLN